MSISSSGQGQPLPQGPLWRIGWDDNSLPQEMDQIVSGGEPADVWVVKFTTRSGVKSRVTIPASAYSAQEVAGRIQPLAEEIERVHALTSDN